MWPMLTLNKRTPGHSAALDRVRDWVRARFALDDAAILVAEVAAKAEAAVERERGIVGRLDLKADAFGACRLCPGEHRRHEPPRIAAPPEFRRRDDGLAAEQSVMQHAEGEGGEAPIRAQAEKGGRNGDGI